MNHQVGIAFALDDRVEGPAKLVSKHRLRATLVASLIVSDIIAIVAGVSIGDWLRASEAFTVFPFARTVAVIPLYLLSAAALRACTGEALINLAQTIRRSTLALATTAALLVFMLFAFQESQAVSRLGLVAGFAIAGIFLMVTRFAHMRFARDRLDGELYSVLVLHDGPFATTISKGTPALIGSNFDAENLSAEDYHRLAGMISTADRVVVRCAQDRRELWAHILQGMNVHAEIIAPEISAMRALAIGSFAGRPTYVVARGPLSLRDRLVKRCFDIFVSLSAIVFIAPLLLAIAIAVKIESRGPVIFTQQRIGRQNRLFNIYKFRSMRTEMADANGARSASRDDERITRVGRFIRSVSADELPQLFNVLKGDMSIVGPRPHAVSSTAQSKLFWEVDERYWYRHACKPGITGLAQVRGFRGATHHTRDLTDRLEADLEYLADWSFWNDIAIILKTAKVLIHRNAY